MIGVVAASIRERGFWRTFVISLYTVADYTFDWRFGTDTRRWAELDSLEIDSANRAGGVRYVPTRTGAFLRVMASVSFPEGSVFMDCGCGKGKVLLLAAQLPFRRVVGVEFSEELCAIAKSNVELFQTKRKLVPIDVVHQDVLAYSFSGDENVLFLFDPFDDTVLEPLLDRVFESLRLQPRSLWVVYHNPVYRSVIEARSEFQLVSDFTYGGSQFLIYTYRLTNPSECQNP